MMHVFTFILLTVLQNLRLMDKLFYMVKLRSWSPYSSKSSLESVFTTCQVLCSTSSCNCFPNIVPTNLVSISTLWHNRLGHPYLQVLNDVLTMCNKPTLNRNKQEICVACCMGKLYRLPAKLSTTVYTYHLELTFCDLWGPFPLVSSMGF